MRRYRVTLTVEFEIEAENVAVASEVAGSIRTVGERYGWSSVHGRHRVTRVSEHRTLPRSVVVTRALAATVEGDVKPTANSRVAIRREGGRPDGEWTEGEP